MFDVAAADARGELGAKCVVFVGGVSGTLAPDVEQFLLHDVGMTADASFEEGSFFKDRWIDALVARLTCAVTYGFLDVRHVLVVSGEHIVHPFGGSVLQFGHDAEYSSL